MKNSAEEEVYLLLADRHIEEAEQRICMLKIHLAELIAQGRSATQKENFIALMMDGLASMRHHRAQIFAGLNDYDKPADAPGRPQIHN